MIEILRWYLREHRSQLIDYCLRLYSLSLHLLLYMRSQQSLLVDRLSASGLLLLYHHLISHLSIESLLVNKCRCFVIGRANKLNDCRVLIPWHLLDTNNVVLVRVGGARSFLLALHHLSLSLPLNIVSNGDVIELMKGFDYYRVDVLL